MNSTESNQEFSQFLPQKILIYVRASFMLFIGGIMSVFSLITPDVQMMSVENGWLPLVAFILLLVGLLEWFDTYISRDSHRFIINLQFAVMDSIFGILILFSLGNDIKQIALLIAAYLMVKGIFRFIAALAGGFPHVKSTIVGSLITTILGFLIWVQWPSSLPVGFLAFSLSLEITLRGFALLYFASWLGSIEN
jgi:uncharacterized membrane protein HdeD (DUF308 family)